MKLLLVLFLTYTSYAYADIHYKKIGIASYYGPESGRITANGERFNPYGLTAASWELPFNSWLKVTNLTTNKIVLVRVNDRGPNKRLHRLIDLSLGAAKKLGIVKNGLAQVLVERI
jgi:rare lipoprotein A